MMQLKGGSFTGKDVNNWIKKNTGNQIDSVVDNDLPKDLLALLVSAVYFAAPWTTKFNGKYTARDGSDGTIREH